MGHDNPTIRLAYLAPEFGAVTSTFIYREIDALERRGAVVDTYSTTRPVATVISAEAAPRIAATRYLYEASATEVVRAVLRMAAARPGTFVRQAGRALRDAFAAQVPTPADRLKLLGHFCVAALLARDLIDRGTRHLHAHFAHVPTSIAMYAAGLAGIPYSFTAHANDIFERPTALKEKVARSAFTACISEYNRRYLSEMGCDADRQIIVRCALDTESYSYRERNGRSGPPVIYTVGRIVEKKGMDDLVDALALLRERGRSFYCRIVGDGPLLEPVRRQVRSTGLEDCVELMGAQPQERVKELFEEADIFVLACRVAQSGDRDGIPVALMEAMALGVPVVSTTVSGIPELIESGRSGLLAPPGDSGALADALDQLLQDGDAARAYAREARRTLETTFESARNAEILWEKINECIGSSNGAA